MRSDVNLANTRVIRSGVGRLIGLYFGWLSGPLLYAAIASLFSVPAGYASGYYWLYGSPWISLIVVVIACQWFRRCPRPSYFKNLYSTLLLWLTLSSLSMVYLLILGRRTVESDEETAFPLITTFVELREWFGNQTELFTKTIDSLTTLFGFRTLPTFPGLSLRQEWMFDDIRLHLVFLVGCLLLFITFWTITRLAFNLIVVNKWNSGEARTFCNSYWLLSMLGGVTAFFPLRWISLNHVDNLLMFISAIGTQCAFSVLTFLPFLLAYFVILRLAESMKCKNC